MKNQNEVLHKYTLRQTEKIISKGSGKVGFLTIENNNIDGSHITVNGKDLVSFGSCIYTGLETDSRLKEAAVQAIFKYGVHFCSSRAYLSVTLYKEAEEILAEIFNCPTIIAPSITLAHQSCIPIVVEENDAVLIDARAHESMQIPVKMLELRDIPIETVRHNNLEQIEEKILELKGKHRRIWYFCDGVYSTFGDLAPIQELKELLDRYEQFHVYADDAHGISWIGRNGMGYAPSRVEIHPRMYFISSLAKGFGCTGGVIVIPNDEVRNRVRQCGMTLMFSNPLPPPVLGAIIASAKIHLSDEIYERQRGLQRRISVFNEMARLYELPLLAPNQSPINFIALGSDAVGFNLTKRLFNHGFYTNWSVYPSVPVNQSGVRILVTLHHTIDEIERLLGTVAQQLPLALEEEGQTMDDIYKRFKNEFATVHSSTVLQNDFKIGEALAAKSSYS